MDKAIGYYSGDLRDNMKLKSLTKQPFEVEVREYTPRNPTNRCPTRPSWVNTLITNGLSLNLEPVLVQAGRHFSDSLNMSVVQGTATRRQEATRLAWLLVSMLHPTVSSNRLVVTDPNDQDIRRLASEILGVGASLELLRRVGLIDGRTIRKISGRFDFEANGFPSAGKVSRVSIEAKGTMNLASVKKQRASFLNKLHAHGLTKPGLRGYSRAVGVIFSTWTDVHFRGPDFELLDPEGDAIFDQDEALRAVIKFYARRFDETARLPRAAEQLWSLAQHQGRISEIATMDDYLGRVRTTERIFNRSSFTFPFPDRSETYWGTFWNGSMMPYPFRMADGSRVDDMPYAYTGIDRRVIDLLRERRFDDLLQLRTEEREFQISFGENLKGYFMTDTEGVVRGWMNGIPEGLEHVPE